MAKKGPDAASQAAELLSEIKQKIFKPVYLLMGDEPYYPELVCDAIIDNCLEDYEKDFNQTIAYGADVKAEDIITAARRFPMMADRQLVVVKEAQMLKDIEQLALYCANPLDSTVLVILMHGASADKRKAFYKSALKAGVVLESPAIRDYEIERWISSYYSSRGLSIDPPAARLLGESAGTSLQTIVSETEKLLRNLPEGAKVVTVEDIEKNVGVSRVFSVFELTKALSYRDARTAVKVAGHIGNAAKFAMPAAISALYMHFYRVLRYEALLIKGTPSPEEKTRVLGVAPYFFRDYDAAASNYPLPKCMATIGLLLEYDFKGKGGGVSGDTSQGELLTELTTKLLSL